MVSYYEFTRTFFNDISLSLDIDSDYDEMLTALHNAARLCVPRGQATFFKYYWDDDLNDLKMKSLEAHRLWVECGWPHAGFVLQERCRTRAAYKRALRNKRREKYLTVSNDLHECLLAKDIDGFWCTWKCKFGAKTTFSVCVDGVADSRSIALSLHIQRQTSE